MKFFFTFFTLLLFTLSLGAQTVPQKNGRKRQGNRTPSSESTEQTQPVRQGTRTQTPVSAAPKPKMTNAYANVVKREFPMESGKVEVSVARSRQPHNDVQTTSSPANAALCLTKEEVRGQKVEAELVIADGSKALAILPGGIIDVNELLRSGQFRFVEMTNRKPVTLSTTANPAKRVVASVPAGRANGSIEDDLRQKVHSLTRASNIEGEPSLSSSNEASISTLQESIGVNIGASFFYMGVSADNKFKFSSSRYRYMYVYQFEQACMAVMANEITSAQEVFRESPAINNNWLYVREVKYGRRLYVLMESEYDLQKYSNELNGNLEWGAVSASLKVKTKGSTLSQKTNIRVLTQGGQFLAITDPANIQKELDRYFATPFRDMDIVPLSYKLTYLDGTPVSMVTEAFLNGKNCLSNNKVRVRVSKIECQKADDNKKNEEVYGSVSINLFNLNGKKVWPDGKTPVPDVSSLPSGSFSFGSKEAPLVIEEGSGRAKTFDINQQGKYLDILVHNLDMPLEIKPVLKEKDTGLNADDDFVTQDRVKKTLRQMLTEGSTSPVFEFRFKNAVMLVYFEIIPTL